jgi:hypothetical protein
LSAIVSSVWPSQPTRKQIVAVAAAHNRLRKTTLAQKKILLPLETKTGSSRFLFATAEVAPGA